MFSHCAAAGAGRYRLEASVKGSPSVVLAEEWESAPDAIDLTSLRVIGLVEPWYLGRKVLRLEAQDR